MKTHVSHEIRIHRLAGFAMIITMMSIFTYRTSEFPLSQTAFQTKAGGLFRTSPAISAKTEIQNSTSATIAAFSELKSNDGVIESLVPEAPALTENNGAISKSTMQVTESFTMAELLEFAAPETEDALQLEDWMVDLEFWGSPSKEAGAIDETAEENAVVVPRVKALTMAAPVIGSPEWIAEMSVIDVEPPLVWATQVPGLDEWIASEIPGGAVAISWESFEPVDFIGNFDCEAALKSQIRLNEAMVEETEAPLRLESWMLDESLFSPELKVEDPSSDTGLSENRKNRDGRN